MAAELNLALLAEQAAAVSGLSTEQVPGLLELFKMVDREAYARGAADVEQLKARVLELQGEIGELNMRRDREEKADTTCGGELTAQEILGAVARAQCQCGHLLHEHGADDTCNVLACPCRLYRAGK